MAWAGSISLPDDVLYELKQLTNEQDPRKAIKKTFTEYIELKKRYLEMKSFYEKADALIKDYEKLLLEIKNLHEKVYELVEKYDKLSNSNINDLYNRINESVDRYSELLNKTIELANSLNKQKDEIEKFMNKIDEFTNKLTVKFDELSNKINELINKLSEKKDKHTREYTSHYKDFKKSKYEADTQSEIQPEENPYLDEYTKNFIRAKNYLKTVLYNNNNVITTEQIKKIAAKFDVDYWDLILDLGLYEYEPGKWKLA